MTAESEDDIIIHGVGWVALSILSVFVAGMVVVAIVLILNWLRV